MPDKSNDTGSRMTHRTAQGFARDVPQVVKHGTPEEIGNRVGGTFRTLPDNVPSNFKQLGPESQGGVFQQRKIASKSGNQKFGNAKRYV